MSRKRYVSAIFNFLVCFLLMLLLLFFKHSCRMMCNSIDVPPQKPQDNCLHSPWTRLTQCHFFSNTHAGCGKCWAIDGNWKLTFPHCMFPVTTCIPGMSKINFPNVCTKQPKGNSAFCCEHHEVALSKSVPTDVRKFLQQYERAGNEWSDLLLLCVCCNVVLFCNNR